MRTWWVWNGAKQRCVVAAAAVATLVACGEPRPVESASPPIANRSVAPAAKDATDVLLQPVPAYPVEDISSTQLELVHGTFLGIGTGSSLPDALRTFGVSPVAESADQSLTLSATPGDIGPCLPQLSHWVIHADALTLIFEGRTESTAQLTSWRYAGGAAIGFTTLVVSKGLTVGGTRQALLSRFPHAVDHGDSIDTGDSINLRFGMSGDSIAWFGHTDCGQLVSQSGQPVEISP